MKHILLVLFCVAGFLSEGQISYVPASPYPIEIEQPDGTKLMLKAKGNEKVNVAITEDGYTVVKNDVGIYEYAKLDDNKELMPSGFKARNLSERSPAEVSFLSGVKKSIFPQHEKNQEFLKSTAIQKSFPTSGNHKTLMLLIDYPDLTSTYSESSFNTLMNGASGSFREYYIECSDNGLSVSVDVFGWYRASKSYIEYGEDKGDNAARDLVVEAVDAAEAAGVDFSEYDNDNDGYVDNLMIVHAGPGAEEGRQTQYIWSHNWALWGTTYAREYDGVTIYNYSIQPETRIYTGGMVGIGVFCHEFGHALGLPDLYDTDYSSDGIGDWCLMSGGAWLNSERTPAMMSAWCREELGWINPTVIPYPITGAYEGSYSLQPAANSTECYKIRTQNSNEYFLLENTYKTGYNRYLPGSGLAIYHVNTFRSDNDDETRKLVDMEEADGLEELDIYTDYGNDTGDSGDVFPGSSNNTEFNDNTNPNAKTYTSAETGVEILNINLSGSTVNFTIGSQSEPMPNLTFNPSQNSFAVNGTNVEMDLQVQNEGDENAGSFEIAYYLSANTTVTTSDYLIGTDSKSSLSAGSEVFAGLAVDVSTIPGIPNGAYYLGYIIDNLDDVDESNENDNAFINTSVQVELNSYPNLTYVEGENNLTINNNIINIEMAVLNNGNTASEACRVGYYLSPDMNITISDYKIDDDFVGILTSGQAGPEMGNIDASYFYGLAEGIYYVGYIIDYQDNVDEEDEGDNTIVFESPTFTYCPGSLTEVDETICEGESFWFQGNLYDEQGEYVFNYTNTYGCDSVIILNLTVVGRDITLLDETICEGESYQLGNKFYSEPGIYDEVFVNQYGCDSVVVLNLEVRANQVNYKFAEICAGNEFQLGTYSYSEEGIYEMNFTDKFGCDSIVILNLSVFPVNDTTITKSICPGEFFEFGGEFYNTAGIYTHTFENRFGCDSVVTLDLQINDTKEVFFTESICSGDSVVVGGEAFYETGIYEMNLTTYWGCDSIIHLDLTVYPTHQVDLVEKICEGDVFYIGEEEFTETGIYERNLQNQFGCDSVIHLDLTVCPVRDTIIYKTLCEKDLFVFENIDYSKPGIYERTLENECGCTYHATIYIEVNPRDQIRMEAEICEGDSYQVGNSYYSETGIYRNVLENRFGCDSVVVLDLIVNPVSYTNIEETICEGDSIILGSSVYKETGVFENHFENSFGCDSVVVLDLTVNSVSHTFISETICEGENITIGNSVYTSSGFYVDYFENQLGCDSIVELDLHVNPVYDTTIYVEICQGFEYPVGEFLFDKTGVYLVELTNRFGCDSLVVLDLEVLPVSDTLLEVEICEGDSITVGTSVYKTSGIYTNLLTNHFGCDSLVTLNLNVHPGYNILITENICEGESFTVGNSSYTESGIYETYLSSRFGCDSVVTLDLMVNPLSDTMLFVELCRNDTFMLGNQKIYQAGNYSAVFTNRFGCDSLVNTEASFKPIIYNDLSYDICTGDSLLVGNLVYKTSGIYIDTLVSRFGCDSVITTNLTVLPGSDTVIYEAICNGDSYFIADVEYSSEGIYYQTLENHFGCDSLITLNLEILPVDESYFELSVCEGESITVNREVFSEAGRYFQTLKNQFGCDSVVTFDLYINEVKDTLLEVEICNGSEFELGGKIYYETGIYEEVFTSQTGCDSIVTLNLKILPNNETIIEKSVCEGDFITFAGEEIYESGIYTDYLKNQYGCDSVIILNLAVNQSDETILEETICEGESVLFGNKDYSTSGIYTQTITNQWGCDSLVVLNLVVNPASDTALYYDIPHGDSIVIGSSVYKTTGIYTEYLTNKFGCDSLIVLDLNVSEQVQVGVKDLSDSGGAVSLYPNPAKETVTLEMHNLNGEYTIRIVSMGGKIIYANSIKIGNNPYVEKIGLHKFSQGIYSVIIESEKGLITKKLIVR